MRDRTIELLADGAVAQVLVDGMVVPGIARADQVQDEGGINEAARFSQAPEIHGRVDLGVVRLVTRTVAERTPDRFARAVGYMRDLAAAGCTCYHPSRGHGIRCPITLSADMLRELGETP